MSHPEWRETINRVFDLLDLVIWRVTHLGLTVLGGYALLKGFHVLK